MAVSPIRTPENEPILRCIHCRGSRMERRESAYHCSACGRDYPIICGVPLFLRDVSVRLSGQDLPDEVSSAICGQIGVLPGPGPFAALREVFATSYLLGDTALDAENNYFLNRVVVSESDKRKPLNERAAGLPLDERPRFRIESHLIPPVLPAFQRVSHNVRVTNTGDAIFASRGPNPVYLSYIWRKPSGRRVETEQIRTPFPIDLHPGRSLTVPVMIDPPGRPGRYLLDVTLVHEHVAWLEEGAVRVPIWLSPLPRRDTPRGWRKTNTHHPGYDADHIAGRKMLGQEFKRRGTRRVLEVGGCCNPYAHGLGVDKLYVVDIDIQTLQVGHIKFTHLGQDVQFFAADAHDLPFDEGAFDSVVMFSALHHFADPVVVLDRLRTMLRPGGFLAVMCEPIDHYFGPNIEPPLLAELEQGINEQVFNLREHEMIFRRARLKPVEVRVDVGSLKAILRAQSPPAASALWNRRLRSA
jgi:uncharacterized protein YbaR (Trm112 family)